MLKNQLIQWVGKIALGKEIALAVILLRCVRKAAQERQAQELTRFAHQQFLTSCPTMQAPVSEAEFTDLLQAGQLFLSKIQTVFKTA